MELKDILSAIVIMEVEVEGRRAKLEFELEEEEIEKLLEILQYDAPNPKS